MNEDKATRYHRLRRRAEVGTAVTSGLLLGVLMLSGGSVWLRDLAWQIASSADSVVLQRALAVTLFVSALVVMHEVLATPWAFYLGFLLEHKYELSREPASMWLRDHLKAIALGWIFAAAAALLLQAVMLTTYGWWWLASAAAFSGVMILLTTIAPILLLPLFYRVTPIDRDTLVQRLLLLAQRARTRVLGVYEWRLGEKTRKANAALVGLRHTRRILVSDTLLEQFSDEEIEVVLAHELAHHVHRDIWRGLVFETTRIALSLAAAGVVLALAGPSLGLTAVHDLAALPLLLLVVGACGLASVPLSNALSRAHERRADRYALDLTGNAPAFMSAMRRLGAQNLAEDEPSRTVELFFYTHPPLNQRIAAARAWQAAKGTG